MKIDTDADTDTDTDMDMDMATDMGIPLVAMNTFSKIWMSDRYQILIKL
jgi:hypothetical protein